MRVLVGYATAYGSTREIAHRIAARLSEAGLPADARPMGDVTDVDAYQAFVLGSAVHAQDWLDSGKRFLNNNIGVLGSRPVWIFSVGMPAALRGPWKRMAAKETAVIADSLPGALRYRDHRLFSGVISRTQIPFLGRLVFHLLGGRFGDYRDWPAIDEWSVGIVRELTYGA